ncbi:enoyl-CoA hydratase-related protein [Aureimonas fodinaquatilis]|nr:enoyl-CoA hydratase-related protein [Aureimonas fodinaquatilis]
MSKAPITTGDTRISCVIDEIGVALVTIERPEKRNAMALSMWTALRDIFLDLGQRSDLRCIILTGKGDHFCAGADISEFDKVRADSAAGLKYDRINDETTLAIRDCPKPVIAAVSGFTVGGGLGLALACDFRVAHSSLRAGIPAGRLGLVYSVLDCSLLVERLGLTAAKEVLLTGAIVDLDNARRLGLTDRVTEGNVVEAAHELAAEIARNAPLSLAGNKAILNALANGTAKDRAGELENLIARAFDSDDYREGQRAFAERRPAVFCGR